MRHILEYFSVCTSGPVWSSSGGVCDLWIRKVKRWPIMTSRIEWTGPFSLWCREDLTTKTLLGWRWPSDRCRLFIILNSNLQWKLGRCENAEYLDFNYSLIQQHVWLRRPPPRCSNSTSLKCCWTPKPWPTLCWAKDILWCQVHLLFLQKWRCQQIHSSFFMINHGGRTSVPQHHPVDGGETTVKLSGRRFTSEKRKIWKNCGKKIMVMKRSLD